jgi:hypothetical protein
MDHVRREGAEDCGGRVKPPKPESLFSPSIVERAKAIVASPTAYSDREVRDYVVGAMDLDDYDDERHLHLVDPLPPAPNVIVEAVGGGFEVSRLRDNGSTVACVMWTRTELLELIARAQAALKVT